MKQTLPIVEKVLKSYVDKLFQIDVETDDEFYAAVNKAKDELLADIKDMRSQHSELFYLNYSKTLAESSAKEIVKKIAQNAKTHYALDVVPSTEFYIDEVQGEIIKTPAFIPSLEGYNELLLANADNPKKEINQFLLALLLFLPIKKIKYTFVDFGGSLLSDFFLKQINPTIYNKKLITDTYEFKDYLKRMKEKVVKNIQQYQDVRQYNIKNKSIVEPYEVIVLFDNADKGSKEYLHDYETELNALKRNCAAGGVYIIDFYKKIQPPKEPEKYDVRLDRSNESRKLQLVAFVKEYLNTGLYEAKTLVDKDLTFAIGKSLSYADAVSLKQKIEKAGFKANIISQNPVQKSQNKSSMASIVYPTFIEDIPALQQACVDYINSEAAKEEETRIISMDLQSESQKSFEPLNDTMSIPIGKSGNMEIALKMEIGGIRAHSFIIGQSGSGKSVLLHNIISGLMLTYSPDDLELYLLDFKLGGVEFNRYKEEKHVHAMLVDNSDPQITLEILRELRDRMAERGKKLRQSGCNTIKEYNLQHSDDKMKRILFVADECHEMFRIDDNNRAIGREISEILTMIVKEGRSQGVHLLLATQTLANTEIGSEITTNIGNHLMLKCSVADSEKLAQNTSKITSGLKTGAVYYHEENVTLQAYYADKEQVKHILDAIKQKTEPYSSNETFYFSGASIFHFEPSVAIESSNSARKCKKMPVAFAGKSIDIKQKDVAIPLSEDYSENILLLGLNDDYQSTRTSMNLLVSLLATSKSRGADVDFKVIDCLSDDDKYKDVLDELAEAGLVDVILAKKRANFFKQLAEGILTETAKETILLILGQDRFRELKLDMELEDEASASDDSGLMMINSPFNADSAKKKKVQYFSEAMNVILDKGPEAGVHTIIQLEKTANYLFTDYISHKELFQKFKHLILLKSDENAAMQLHLRNDIRLENLNKEEERLRAYYYAEESDTYTLFTPYMPLEGKELKQIIKTL